MGSRTVIDMRTFEDRGVYQDFGIVDMDWDEDLHRDSMREYYWYLGFDPCKTLMLYYDESVNMFFEVGAYDNGFLEPVFDIYRILEPWKVKLFKKNGNCVFPSRNRNFIVELTWLPF